MREIDSERPTAGNPDALHIQAGSRSDVRLRAALLFLGLIVVYQADGGFQETFDAAYSTYLPLFVIQNGSLTVTPSEMPAFFGWEHRSTEGSQRVAIMRWTDELSRARDAGELVPIGPRYFLVPTLRTDPNTGERRYANTFGVGAGLSALPVYATLNALRWRSGFPRVWPSAKFAASLLVAGSAVFVLWTCVPYVGPRPALWIATAYGVGTCVWSISSQALWQHGPSEFFLALGTLLLSRSRGNVRCAAACGFAFALAVACRPTGAVAVVAAGVHFLIADRKGLASYILAGLPVAVCLGAYQKYNFGSPFSFGRNGVDQTFALEKTGSPETWHSPFGEGLAGIMFSPSRGLLVHSPILIFGIAGLVLVWRRPEYRELRAPAASVVTLILIASAWYDWWGGWCFGYRPIVDTAPLLAVLMVPVVAGAWRYRAFRGGFGVLLAWSIGVQFLGAFAYHQPGWNAPLIGYRVIPTNGPPIETASHEQALHLSAATPGSRVVRLDANIDVPRFRERLWSIDDNQLAYLLVNFRALRVARQAGNEEWVRNWE